MGFPRQEYWSGLPFPPPGDLPNPGIQPVSPALLSRFFIVLCYFFSIIYWEVYKFYRFFSKNQLLVSFYLVLKFLFYWFLDIILTFFPAPLFFVGGNSIQLAGSQFPWPGTEPGPLPWKLRVSTLGLICSFSWFLKVVGEIIDLRIFFYFNTGNYHYKLSSRIGCLICI